MNSAVMVRRSTVIAPVVYAFSGDVVPYMNGVRGYREETEKRNQGFHILGDRQRNNADGDIAQQRKPLPVALEVIGSTGFNPADEGKDGDRLQDTDKSERQYGLCLSERCTCKSENHTPNSLSEGWKVAGSWHLQAAVAGSEDRSLYPRPAHFHLTRKTSVDSALKERDRHA